MTAGMGISRNYRRDEQASDSGGHRSERQSSTQGPSPSPVENTLMDFNRTPQTIVSPGQDGTPVANFPEAKSAQVITDSATMTQFMKPKFARAPIKEAGRVAYLGTYGLGGISEYGG